jgi:hypothetical protein
MCWTHFTQTNTNNLNKTWVLLQTTGGKDEPNIKKQGVKSGARKGYAVPVSYKTPAYC